MLLLIRYFLTRIAHKSKYSEKLLVNQTWRYLLEEKMRERKWLWEIPWLRPPVLVIHNHYTPSRFFLIFAFVCCSYNEENRLFWFLTFLLFWMKKGGGVISSLKIVPTVLTLIKIYFYCFLRFIGVSVIFTTVFICPLVFIVCVLVCLSGITNGNWFTLYE